ncbi:unnamed protein product [Dovyalis caffra]|uniref:Sodium/metabolite cotransporter BASS4, chloroplastic n=1 Tax=Dovyalis caffra TaxID=77055 RepID=A0AAV1QU00_9ROSI|nr:unnamed protein product [Dovyalis caffra]
MAGTIQTLILTTQSTQTPSFRHQSLKFPAIRTTAYSSRSVYFNHSRSISFPHRIRANQRPDQANGNESGGAKALRKSLLDFTENNFLPLALIGGVVLGLTNPTLGCLADKYYLSKFSTFAIFITSGLTLRNGEIGDAIEAWPVGVLGLCSILLFTPFFSKIILQIQLQPQEFVTGLALFCCMPTTLSSGVALTQRSSYAACWGNSALALAMTVISNLLGILIVSSTNKIEACSEPVISNASHSVLLASAEFDLYVTSQVPFSISRFIAAGVGVSVPTKQLLRSLVITLLIPLILGKVFRESFKSLADYVDQNRKLFSKMNAIFLSLVPFIQVSRSRSLLLMVKPSVFLVAIGMGGLLHLILLAFNALAIQGLSAVSSTNHLASAKEKNAVAYVLVASQWFILHYYDACEKTLPVMVAVVEQLGGAFGESGLLVLPCVAAHLNQVLHV